MSSQRATQTLPKTLLLKIQVNATKIEIPVNISPCCSNTMSTEEIFDKNGRIRPLKDRHMATSSNRQKVNKYGRMYTLKLVSDAQGGASDFELFMELHRRAAEHFLKHRKRYDWDNKLNDSIPGDADMVFTGEYDRKWGVYQRNGCSYMFAEIPSDSDSGYGRSLRD